MIRAMGEATIQGPRETRMIEVVFPSQTNHLGTLFGGHALRMMDMTAAIAAHRYGRATMVTVSVQDVQFTHPVRHGQIAELTAWVAEVGRTSLTVTVELVAEDLLSGERVTCSSGRFVFVALDEDGRPKRVPPLTASG
jgi:acyl-CoA hydrolase